MTEDRNYKYKKYDQYGHGKRNRMVRKEYSAVRSVTVYTAKKGENKAIAARMRYRKTRQRYSTVRKRYRKARKRCRTDRKRYRKPRK